MRKDYSEKEIELFKACGGEEYLNHAIYPPLAYRMLVETVFLNQENISVKAVNSLRRCYQAINNCNPYRLTEEFDDLIKL